MYDRILVATDGSETAGDAATHAAALAREHGADLHAAYVVETRTGYDNAIVDPGTVRRALREEGETALAAVESAAGDYPVETALLEGVPHEELLEYVADEGIDLVVVGAVGRSAFENVLLGSVTDTLVRSAAVPVLVVGGGVPPGENGGQSH